ncbi:DUF4238 domain-containing protein [Lentzea sp. NPDC102401]|uniref:DUF4238 domain-containing protein n=1 Tax=Lentzea sp. NPDC102401 TaxID=3364128 RepID=UPI00381DFC7E
MHQQNLKRRHHTVPRSHLERFARPPAPGKAHAQLTRVELPGTDRRPISVTSATVVNDFYLTRTPDGALTDAFEDQLSTVEGDAAAAVRDLVDQAIWPITTQNRKRIARWVALQHLRTPGERDLLGAAHELTREITSRGIGSELQGFAGPGPHTYVRQGELSRPKPACGPPHSWCPRSNRRATSNSLRRPSSSTSLDAMPGV